MAQATFCFFADLQDFLPPDKRQPQISCFFNPPQSVKHLIEALGPPHSEVEAIFANDRPVDFSYQVQDGDEVRVYPWHELPQGVQIVPLRPLPPSPARFVLDIHLGQLARYLRLLGFDTLYPDQNHNDADLATLAAQQGRILLTRDRGLLKRSKVVHGYCLPSRNPREQVTAVLRRYQLFNQIQPLPRCLRCNGILRPVAKAEILHRLEPKTQKYYETFHLCTACDQVYWQGSHYPAMQRFVTEIREKFLHLGLDGCS